MNRSRGTTVPTTDPPSPQPKPAVMWPVSNLKDHALQAHLIGNLSNEEIDALAADIKSNGLKIPLRILPDGTIVEGHQRRRAVQLLGWTEVPVIVDDALAKQGKDAVERALIMDNLARRNADKLRLVQWHLRMIELEKGRPIDQLGEEEHKHFRERIAQKLQLGSGRTVSRYLQILRTPSEVQDAFRASELTLMQACEVERLSAEDQQAIAAEIRAGKSPKQVVARFAAQSKSKAKPPDAIFSSFKRKMNQELPAVVGILKKIRCFTVTDVENLTQWKGLLDRVLKHAQKNARPVRLDDGVDVLLEEMRKTGATKGGNQLAEDVA